MQSAKKGKAYPKELKQFIDYAEKQRKEFSYGIGRSFYSTFTTEDKVQIENLLIAYDQLVDRLKQTIS